VDIPLSHGIAEVVLGKMAEYKTTKPSFLILLPLNFVDHNSRGKAGYEAAKTGDLAL